MLRERPSPFLSPEKRGLFTADYRLFCRKYKGEKRRIKGTKGKEKSIKKGPQKRPRSRGKMGPPCGLKRFFLSEGDHGLGSIDLEGKGFGQEEAYLVSAVFLKTEGEILTEDELEIPSPEGKNKGCILA